MVRGAYCSLRHVDNPRRATFRVAVVVSRKVNKSAAVRNRIRRRVYELIRTKAASIRQPADLVFTVYSDQMSCLSAAQLQQIITDQLNEAGLVVPEVVPPPIPSRDIVVPKET
jgi:ribonuclease P protein component